MEKVSIVQGESDDQSNQESQFRDEKGPEGPLGETKRRQIVMHPQANMVSVKATEQELERAYADLRRLLQLGRVHEAIRQAILLAKSDSRRLWDYLREYASVEVTYRETTPLLVVKALSDNWQATEAPVFIAHAITALIGAPKGDSIAKFLP